MVSALDSGSRCQGLSPGRGHCVVFLGKTLHSHGPAKLMPGISSGVMSHLVRTQTLPSPYAWAALHRMAKEMQKNKELKVNEVKARKSLTSHRKRK